MLVISPRKKPIFIKVLPIKIFWNPFFHKLIYSSKNNIVIFKNVMSQFEEYLKTLTKFNCNVFNDITPLWIIVQCPVDFIIGMFREN